MPLPRYFHSKSFVSCAALMLFCITFYVFVIDASSRRLVDLAVYLKAAEGITLRENIYHAPFFVIDRWERIIDLHYFYPPFLAHILSKIVFLPVESIKFLWCLLSYTCLVLSAYAVSELLSRSWWRTLNSGQRLLLIFFFAVCFEPNYWGICDGQVTTILLALLCYFLLLAQQKRDALAGLALGLAITIKISPIILLLGALRLGRWKIIGSSIATCLALSAWSIIDLGGFQIFQDFYSSLTTLVEDNSRRMFVFNYVFDKAILEPFSLENNNLARWIIKLLLIATPIAEMLRLRKIKPESEMLVWSYLLCLMVLCSPIIWFHHLSWAFPAICCLSSIRIEDEKLRLKHLTLCLGIYFVGSQLNLLQYWAMKDAPFILWFSTLCPGIWLLYLAWSIAKRLEHDELDRPAVQ